MQQRIYLLSLVISFVLLSIIIVGCAFIGPPSIFSTSVIPPEGGSIDEHSDGPYYVTLTAVAAPDYEFVNWTGDIGEQDAESNSITIFLVGGDKNITANFQSTVPPIPPEPIPPEPPPDEPLTLAPSKQDTMQQRQMPNSTGNDSPLLTMTRFRDEIISANPKGSQMLSELRRNYAAPISKVLYDQPALLLKGMKIVEKHRSGLERVLNGGRMKVSSSDLEEVKAFLEILGKSGDLRLRGYVESVQKILNAKDLRTFGIELVDKEASGKRNTALKGRETPSALVKRRLLKTWGSLKYNGR